MLELNYITHNYLDFLYRLEDFYNLFTEDQQKITKTDAAILYSLIRGTRPDHVLEIGRLYGTSTMIISGALCGNNKGQLDSIDIEDNFLPSIRWLTKKWAVEHLFDSATISDKAEITAKKYQMFFIDGDHSLNHQITDIESCLQVSDSEAWFIMHDADMQETLDAVKVCCNRHQELKDIGRLGDQLYILKKYNLGV